ncbi:minichromosome maintenance protein MCM [Candidatus Woesearchaeota archaeon]|jgi:replicative DNA helicase Mcm|nr:minichromosome maintenance protein MCM [Candidatus Woesearchaeota archaeon]MBT7062723.1 minichromosome maintenance protein MCM [Candidatus Woesearchaeota archaeon]MBT7402853.1 minichromosome maintenance protein MCM [Candidatus Woesearchaeota archaeon]
MENIEANLTDRLRVFIEQYYYNNLMDAVKKGKKSLEINFGDIAKFDLDIADELISRPQEIIEYFEAAVKEFELPKEPEDVIRVRISNLPKSQNIRIRSIRSEHLGKLICVDGIIRQASDVRPKITRAYFNCPSCNQTIIVEQTTPKFQEPRKCPNCGKTGRFILKDKKLVDMQRLLIEESPESLTGGEQAKRIAIFVSEDLLDPKLEKKRYPGNRIIINGIIREIPVSLPTGGQSTKFDLIIDANFLDTVEEEYEDLEISPEDEDEIKALAKSSTIFKKMVNSIAPTIMGYEEIKLAIMLQLFGGSKKERDDGTRMRGDIHLFLVGDPGAGKSEILSYVARLAPKARYVSGKGTSGAGLTASVVKDEFMRGWALEAGALVLANKGICCIDEMDKMSKEDRSSMHEALEQQKISISKANIQATLKAETSVLAAANPKFGRFDPYSPIGQQIEIPSTLISRFDLIFTIRDIPNVETDTKIARHILELQRDINSVEPDIKRELLRKYIAYAKKHYKPILTKEAQEEIVKFYIDLRSSVATDESEIKSIPISARQLQGLVRLSEASARVRLSKKVTKKDAQRAIDLLKNCMKAVGTDPETGKFDIDRISSGISASQRSRIHIVKNVIDKLEAKIGKVIPITDIIKEAISEGIPESKATESVQNLIKKGDLYSPRHGLVQKI